MIQRKDLVNDPLWRKRHHIFSRFIDQCLTFASVYSVAKKEIKYWNCCFKRSSESFPFLFSGYIFLATDTNLFTVKINKTFQFCVFKYEIDSVHCMYSLKCDVYRVACRKDRNIVLSQTAGLRQKDIFRICTFSFRDWPHSNRGEGEHICLCAKSYTRTYSIP